MFRPDSRTLEALNLKLGENRLVYQYYISPGVSDRVEIKVFVYGPRDKIIVSDIDGTITK